MNQDIQAVFDLLANLPLDEKDKKTIIDKLKKADKALSSAEFKLDRIMRDKAAVTALLNQISLDYNQTIEQLEKKQAYIEEINNEVTLQKEEIEAKNEQLSSVLNALNQSINYARRIQASMLPKTETVQEALPGSFIFFRPRDVVSGDFYYFAQTQARPIYSIPNQFTNEKVLCGFENPKTIIAAVDCTGHGVPGAFMSLIANDLLNQIIYEKEISEPNAVLEKLHKLIRRVLKQDSTDNRDGMDIALCVVDLEERTLKFAGAKSPIVVLRQAQGLEYVKGDLMPIGGEQPELERKFKAHQFNIEPGSSFYIFSDGYSDQFGGSENTRYKRWRFMDLLQKITPYSPEEKISMLETELNAWRGALKQIDDILIIGLRFD